MTSPYRLKKAKKKPDYQLRYLPIDPLEDRESRIEFAHEIKGKVHGAGGKNNTSSG